MLEGLPEIHEIVREQVRRGGLLAFIRAFWHVVEPSERFAESWHWGAVAEHLTAVSYRQIRDLVISIPPGTGKSLSACVFWPAYHWGCVDPGEKWIFGSHDLSLVLRDAKRARDIIESEVYQAAFPYTRLKPNSQAATIYETTEGGRRFSTSTNGRGVGWHAGIVVVDDPLKPLAAESTTGKALDNANAWIEGTLSTRQATPERFCKVLIMQRLAAGDPAGVALAAGADHLCLPMEYDPKHIADFGSRLTRVRKADPRTEAGELLCPNRYSAAEVDKLKAALKTPSRVDAQLNQNPTPPGGGIVKTHWIRHYEEQPKKGRWIESWDFGFKATEASHSRVAGHLWAREGERYYLIDWVIGELLDYPGSKALFIETNKRELWKRATYIGIENKANGPALISELHNFDRRIDEKGLNPKDSKQDRLIVHTDKFELGNVLFPSLAMRPDVAAVIKEITDFPRGLHDDNVDCCTAALDILGSRKTTLDADALKRAASRVAMIAGQ